MDFDNSGSPGRFFASLVRELKSLALSNIEYFKDGKHSHHAKFHVAFCMLFEYLDLGIEPCFREISLRVHEFDASPTEKGNGYRSLLRIVQKCCLHLLQISRHVSTNKDSVLFRRAFYMKELEAYVATLGQLRACLYYAQKLMTYCQAGQLFADEETLDDALAEQLMTDVEMLSQDCFYGRCLGFQFCESMQRPLNVVAIAMASFAEGYQENSQIMKVATSLFNSGKYIINPDLRAQQVVNVTRTADIQFCKAFWSITESEIMHQLPSMVCPAVQVDEVFNLGPDAFTMPSTGDPQGFDGEVTITPPCAHTGPAPVQVRLLSYLLREGQEQHIKSARSPGGRTPVPRAPRSPGLVIHCHGGGFVAQSSRSHEVYLRHWAKDLNVPILSIDYSLAPESPFPRALEECFYVYAWAVHNCHKLGSTGERIVLAGDSAGANLIISTAMRVFSFNVRRPDGILGVYTPVLVRYTPSPARLLSLMDPLLPAGILSRCLAAYAGVCDEVSSQLAASVSCHIESSAATLRLSSQENHDDSGWVVVSQDSAARMNTTLSKGTENKRRSSSDVDQPDGSQGSTEDVDLLSRPRGPTPGSAGAMLSSMVSGATDRLVSYMGSYTHLLAKTFSSSLPQTPVSEQVSLLPIPEHKRLEPGQEGGAGGGGGGVKGNCSQVDHQAITTSTDDSPHSFHTPLSTPFSENTTLTIIPNRSSTERGGSFVPMDVDQQGDLVDICLDDDGELPAPASSTRRGNNYMPQRREGSPTLTGELTDGDCMSVDGSGVQHLAPTSATGVKDGRVSQLGVTEVRAAEVDHSAASTILQSTSAMSTSSENLCSLDHSLPADQTGPHCAQDRSELQQNTGQKCPEQRDSSPHTNFPPELPKHSDSPSSLGYSPNQKSSFPSQFLERSDSPGSPSEGAKQSDSSPSLSYKSPTDDPLSFIKDSPAKNMLANPEVGARVCEGQDAGTTFTSAAGDSPMSSSNFVDLVSATCSSPVMAATSSSSLDAAMATRGHHQGYQLPSPDSGCLSDEADKLETSATVIDAMFDDGRSKSSTNRHSLHLNLVKTTSSSSSVGSSSSSLPRSASLPTLGEGVSLRVHSMSPSDFKRERHLAQSPMRSIRNIPIVKNPYMSPLLAPDWLLQGLPHCCLVACHLDPLLDDSVMFTRRLRSLGRTVDLVLIDDLPHGFLNFSLASRDAKAASDLCMRKLKELLKIDQLEEQEVKM